MIPTPRRSLFQDFDASGPRHRLLDVPLSLQGIGDAGYATYRFKVHCALQLSIRRAVSMIGDERFDYLQHFALALGHSVISFTRNDLARAAGFASTLKALRGEDIGQATSANTLPSSSFAMPLGCMPM